MTISGSRGALLRLLLAVIVISQIYTGNASGASGDRFCSRPLLRDYERPLRSVAPLSELEREFPVALPFAPPNVRMRFMSFPLNSGRLIAGSGMFGASITGPTEGAEVDWRVLSRIVRLKPSAPASVAREVSVDVDRVSSVSTSALAFANTPGQPGSYRYEISFTNSTGAILGQYGRYVQVLRPRLLVNLALEDRNLKPGQLLVSRWDNPGTELIEVKPSYLVQRRVAGQWRTVKGGPASHGFLPVSRIGAGATSGCRMVRLPNGLSKGTYRLMRFVSRSKPFPGASDVQPLLRRTVTFWIR